MIARIIFRGLTLFTFDEPTAGAAPNSRLGKLTAWLISDPAHSGHPLHRHVPKLGWIQKDEVVAKQLIKAKQVEIGLVGQTTPPGVTVEESFLQYVPRLRALYDDDPNAPHRPETVKALEQSKLVTTRIVIPNGRIYSGDFISWNWHGSAPANVAYMGTRFQGYGANEVVVEIGDDSDTPNAFLQITLDGKKAAPLKPYTKADKYRDKNGDAVDFIEPNVVEVEIGNLTARRSPVFWGLHFWPLFAAGGYTALGGRRIPNQFNAFVAVATGMDRYRAEWNADFGMMTMGGDPFWPFPFLTDLKPPLDQIDATGPGGLSGKIADPGHDPVNVFICPFGRE